VFRNEVFGTSSWHLELHLELLELHRTSRCTSSSGARAR